MMRFPVADQRTLRGVAATLRWQNLDGDGEPTQAPGDVTVGITRADGTVVLPAGTATVDDGYSEGERAVELPADDVDELDWLTATWSVDGAGAHRTLLEVVGGYYFTATAARSFHASIDKLDPTDIVAARRSVEDDFERIAAVAFVPRFARATLSGTGTSRQVLPAPMPRRIRSIATVAGDGTTTAWSDDQVAAVQFVGTTGELESFAGAFPAGTANLVVEWEHGYDRPPGDLQEMALRYLKARITARKSDTPPRAERMVSDGNLTISLARTSAYSTGIDEIDAELKRWGYRIPGFA